ncbi:MAG: DUF1839 family protein [Polyangiaceae bacterium]
MSATERLGYFHNAGYYALEGEDFRELFRLGKPADPQFLPLFAELVKYDRVERLDTPELARRSRENLSFWYARRPSENPFQRFTPVFVRTIEELKARDVAEYHAYAFATIRQFGSCFDLTAQYLRWLGAALPGSIGSAAPHFEAISNSAKAMILKGARAVAGRKAVDFAPMLGDMARAWDDGVTALGSSLAE